MENFDELVALRLQKMTKCEALRLAIDHLELNPTVATETARKILELMYKEEKYGDIIEANLSKV